MLDRVSVCVKRERERFLQMVPNQNYRRCNCTIALKFSQRFAPILDLCVDVGAFIVILSKYRLPILLFENMYVSNKR